MYNFDDFAFLQQYGLKDFAGVPEAADPLVMFFVVCDERDSVTGGHMFDEARTLRDSVKGLLRVFADPACRGQVSGWIEGGRIRKVVKRARGKRWEQVCELPGGHVFVSGLGSKVAVFPPMRMSEQPPALRRLQVSGLNLTPPELADTLLPGSLGVAFDERLGMTTGKKVAQLGHAVQLFLMAAEPGKVQAWLQGGTRVEFVAREVVEGSPDVVVRDAGFTEVPSGSVTAFAKFAVEE